MFDLYANLRPLKAYPNVPVAHPDIDMMFVRENTEDVYRGLEFTINKTQQFACELSQEEIVNA